jgi:hypothetical protein
MGNSTSTTKDQSRKLVTLSGLPGGFLLDFGIRGSVEYVVLRRIYAMAVVTVADSGFWGPDLMFAVSLGLVFFKKEDFGVIKGVEMNIKTWQKKNGQATERRADFEAPGTIILDHD